jgi:hypothetical protein
MAHDVLDAIDDCSGGCLCGDTGSTLAEARAEIARLRAENEALREALKDTASRAHAVLARLDHPR